MRNLRSSKMAEYVSTYAIKMRIGVHDTVLVEKRDASVGCGIFVKDACDAGMSLLVVPSKRTCSLSTTEMIGAKLFLRPVRAEEFRVMDKSIISSLLGCTTEEWAYFAWRLSIERQRSYSPWWGLFGALPDVSEFEAAEGNCERHCRLHHARLFPYLVEAHERMHAEATAVRDLLAKENIVASPNYFLWATYVILSRAQHLPVCWSRGGGEAAVELGVMPFIDLINGHDAAERVRNARVELAFTLEELPDWYRGWFRYESELCGADAEKSLRYMLDEHYFAVVVLEKPLTASAEVILDYELLPWTADGTLGDDEQLQLSRLLRYRF